MHACRVVTGQILAWVRNRDWRARYWGMSCGMPGVRRRADRGIGGIGQESAGGDWGCSLDGDGSGCPPMRGRVRLSPR